MGAEICDAAGQVTDKAQQHIKGGGLNVATSLPARNSIRSQAK